jgi:hypothetical protein
VRNLRRRIGEKRMIISTTKKTHVGSVTRANGICIIVNNWCISCVISRKGKVFCGIYRQEDTLFIIFSVILHRFCKTDIQLIDKT